MTAYRYSQLDRNRAGEFLLVDPNNLQATTSAVCDNARAIFGDLHALSGVFGYEVYVWSELRDDLSGFFRYGVATPECSLSMKVGDEDNSVGYDPAEGLIYNAGAPIGSPLAPHPERVCLGLKLSLSPSLCTCDFLVNGNVVYTAGLPTGFAWLPAFSLGSSVPGDVKIVLNAGQNRFDTINLPRGWSIKQRGTKNFNLSLISEAFRANATAAGIDANTAFAPVILNGKTLSSRREPQAWFHRSGGRSNPAAISVLRVDNSKSAFDELVDADARDSVIKLRRLDAPPGAVGSPAAAVVELTGVLDQVDGPKLSEVEVRIRDTLASFDCPLPVRVIPPFYDSASAGRIYPIGIGTRRLVQPVLLDEPTLLYALGDAPQSNVTLITDGGAPLDPDSSPPQYVPALGGCGFTLDTGAEKRLSADCSTVGPQASTPGVDDVLDGDGAFDTWAGGVPNGWALPTNPPFPPVVLAHGSVTQIAGVGGVGSALRITSNLPYTPTGTGFYFGYPVLRDAVFLQPGMTYRFTFKLMRVAGGTGTSGSKYGFAMYAAFRDSQAYWITPYREPLVLPLGSANQSYTFVYTVPRNESAPLPLILAVISQFGGTSTTIGCFAEIDDLVIEQLGQYVEAPMEGSTLKGALIDILVNRKGEDVSVISTSDAQAIDDATGYKIGLEYTDTPNVLDMMTDAVDCFGGVIFTDADGQARVARLTDPDEGDDPVVASFSRANISLDGFKITNDLAPGLTTNFGGRPNCVPFSPGDFVTDTVTVPVGTRAQYEGECQFYINATSQLAKHYESARSRPRRVLRIDDPLQAATEANRVVSLFSKKRKIYTFTAYARGGLLGNGPSIAPRNFFYGMKFDITLKEKNLFNKRMRLLSCENFIGDKDRKVIIRGWC